MRCDATGNYFRDTVQWTGEQVPEPALFLSRLALGCMTSAGEGRRCPTEPFLSTDFLEGARGSLILSQAISVCICLSVLSTYLSVRLA